VAHVSDALKEPCADPASLPESELSGAQTARYWGADRVSLVDCGRKQKALAKAVDVLEKEASGT
jgi:hypothetical protein